MTRTGVPLPEDLAELEKLEQEVVDMLGQAIKDTGDDGWVTLTTDQANAVRSVLWSRKRRISFLEDKVMDMEDERDIAKLEQAQ
jgi:hypothetical protein